MKEHMPRASDCPCKECSGYRKHKEDRRKIEFEASARETLGPNWKNVLASMGDQ